MLSVNQNWTLFSWVCSLAPCYPWAFLYIFAKKLDILWRSGVSAQVSAQGDAVTGIQVEAVFFFTPLLLLLLCRAQRVCVERLPGCSGSERVLRRPLQSRPELGGCVVTRRTGRAVCTVLLTHRSSDLHLWHGIPEVIDSSHHHAQHGVPLHRHLLQPGVLQLALAPHLPLYEEHECDEDEGHYGQFNWVQSPSENSAEGCHPFRLEMRL